MSLDAMKQALEALEEVNKLSIGENAICLPAEIDGAMDALRAAIEQAEKPWQGLTDDEIKEIIGPWGETPIKGYTRKLFDQIEAKLKEKNT
jgi:hypothetical protein